MRNELFKEVINTLVEVYMHKISVDYKEENIEIENMFTVNFHNFAKVVVKAKDKRKHYFEIVYNQETKEITLDYFVKVDTFVFTKND